MTSSRKGERDDLGVYCRLIEMTIIGKSQRLVWWTIAMRQRMKTLKSLGWEWFASCTGRGTLPNYFSASILGHDAVYLFLCGQESHPQHSASRTITNPRSPIPMNKITSIVGDKCTPRYPDQMLSTLILYRNGEIKEQLVAWGAKQERPPEGIYPRLPRYSFNKFPYKHEGQLSYLRRNLLCNKHLMGREHVFELMRFMTVEPNNHRT